MLSQFFYYLLSIHNLRCYVRPCFVPIFNFLFAINGFRMLSQGSQRIRPTALVFESIPVSYTTSLHHSLNC